MDHTTPTGSALQHERPQQEQDRGVRFHRKVQIRRIPPKATMSREEVEATWFSDAEMDKIKRRDNQLVETILALDDDADREALIAVYGLNSDRVYGSDSRGKRIRACRGSVLQDQEIYFESDVPVDDEVLAESSLEHSEESARQAQHRGLEVSHHVTRELRRTIVLSRYENSGSYCDESYITIEDCLSHSLEARLNFEAQRAAEEEFSRSSSSLVEDYLVVVKKSGGKGLGDDASTHTQETADLTEGSLSPSLLHNI